MTLINTDDLVLLGPGSEWFWTAVSGLVLAVTFIAIYRQLALARSANAFEQIQRITAAWDTERAVRHKLAVLEAIKGGVELESIPESSATFIADFWEGTAVLVRAGHIDLKVLYSLFGPGIRYWWAVIAPNIRRYRAETGIRCLEHFEWLAGRLAERDRSRGITLEFDEAHIRSTIDRRIANFRDDIELAEQLRTVSG